MAIKTISSIAALPDGGFVIVWATQDGSPTYANDGIRAQIYGPTGARVGGELKVNTETPEMLSDPANTIIQDPVVTGLPDGGFMVAWTHLTIAPGGNVLDVKAQVFDASGAKLGSEISGQQHYGRGTKPP